MNQKPRPESLKTFQLIFADFSFLSFDCISPPDTKAKLNNALKNLTFLESSDINWLSFLHIAGRAKNLLHLELGISPKVSWNFKNLSHFKDMTVLDQFTFGFEANSVTCEKEFFPIQELNFTLKGFTWYEIPLMNGKIDSNAESATFFDRLQCHQYLEILSLTTTDRCSYLADKFARFFIHCFTHLQRVSYRNYQSERVMDEQGNLRIKHLYLGEFWKALEPSQRALHEVEIFSFEIDFPEKALEMRFPKLWYLNLEGNLHQAVKFGTMCRSLPKLNQVRAVGLKFTKKRRLEQFFEDFKEISLRMNIKLDFNVECMKPKFLIDCLGKFLKEVDIKEHLVMSFRGVQVESLKPLEELSNLATEKGCFWEFQPNTKAYCHH